jgi:hypothetical protein
MSSSTFCDTVSMPPQRSGTCTDPNIVEGPQKHHPPAYFADNGDPLVVKKAKHRKSKSTRTKSVSVKDKSNTPCPCPALTLTDRSLDEGSETHCRSSTPQITDVETILSESSDKDEEPEEEDDITKLSMFGVPPFMSC